MRYAPKFLQPWERIDRMIEERCAEGHAEIKRMADEARKKFKPHRKIVHANYPDWMAAVSAQNWARQEGMRALSSLEMQEMTRKQMQGMSPDNSQYLYGIGGLAGLAGAIFGQ